MCPEAVRDMDMREEFSIFSICIDTRMVGEYGVFQL